MARSIAREKRQPVCRRQRQAHDHSVFSSARRPPRGTARAALRPAPSQEPHASRQWIDPESRSQMACWPRSVRGGAPQPPPPLPGRAAPATPRRQWHGDLLLAARVSCHPSPRRQRPRRPATWRWAAAASRRCRPSPAAQPAPRARRRSCRRGSRPAAQCRPRSRPTGARGPATTGAGPAATGGGGRSPTVPLPGTSPMEGCPPGLRRSSRSPLSATARRTAPAPPTSRTTRHRAPRCPRKHHGAR
mmetsp:Transcript_30801/g.88982  ORF Transcript_30801/g.88982 Transcript_30801/m.88982 type:complete len:246 (+) Transcript_30801:780-1517(+)